MHGFRTWRSRNVCSSETFKKRALAPRHAALTTRWMALTSSGKKA